MFALPVTVADVLHFPTSDRLSRLLRVVTRGLVGAMLCSLLLHGLLIVAPAWRLPTLDELLRHDAPRLDAHLAPPPPVVTHAAPAHRTPAVAAAAPGGFAFPSSTQPAVAAPVLPDAPPPALGDALLSAIPDIAPPLPRKGHIRFSVVRGEGGFEIGQALHAWSHDGARYELSATTETTGIAALLHPSRTVQQSTGRIVRGDLMPDAFRNDRGEGDVQTARFDWAAEKVVLNGREAVSINGGAEDLLSMFYQLPQAALRGAGFQMPVATGRKVERYAFEWLEETELKLPFGSLRCWHVRVRAASGGADVTEVWLAQPLAGLPVKIRHVDRKGDLFDQIAVDIDYEGKR